MPRGAQPATPDQLAAVSWSVSVERAPFPLIRVTSDASSEARAGRAGPLLEHEELLRAVMLETNHRAIMAGAQTSIGRVHSWRFATQVAPADLDFVREGLERLLTGDESLLRGFLSLPPARFADDGVPYAGQFSGRAE